MPDIFNYEITDLGKAHFLTSFIKNNNFYFAFGKPTSWDSSWGVGVSDTNPPLVNSKTNIIPEIFIFKQAERVNLAVCSGCTESPIFTTQVNNETWSLLDPNQDINQIASLSPSNLYVSASLDVEDFLETSCRAIGLYVGLTLKAGVEQKISYLPSEVENPGVLYWPSYNTPLIKRLDKKVKVEILLSL